VVEFGRGYAWREVGARGACGGWLMSGLVTSGGEIGRSRDVLDAGNRFVVGKSGMWSDRG
jgi:hypothetical protein